MSEGAGFTSQADARSSGDIPEIGIGMLGYAFMGKSHANAFKTIPYMMYPPPAIPKMVAVAGRNEEAVAEAAHRFGYAKYYTDWRDLIADDEVQLFDNGGPNDVHAEPCIAAAQAGKHVLCEKPLGRNAEEAAVAVAAAQVAGRVLHAGYNHRFHPAVLAAHRAVTAGQLGEPMYVRGRYGHGYRGRGRTALTVIDSVEERIIAREATLGLVHDGLAREHRGLAVARARGQRDREQITVRVEIVGQHLDTTGAPFGRGPGVILGQGRQVEVLDPVTGRS